MTILEVVGDGCDGGDEGSCQSVVNKEVSQMRDEHEVKTENDIPVYKASSREEKTLFPLKTPRVKTRVKTRQNQDLHMENTCQQNFREFFFKWVTN